MEQWFTPVFVGKMEVLILKGGSGEDGTRWPTEAREEGAWRPLLRHSTWDPPSPNSTDPGVERLSVQDSDTQSLPAFSLVCQ